ncbi:hypothetical protein HUU05_22505, partial [candidate division KSB1 bacterium]|nr:hypothetical protein [candidate division KSB1 bacterium]
LAPGAFWLGTAAWLHHFNAQQRRFARFPHVPLDPSVSEHWVVKTVYVDAAGEIWMGTNGSGLCCFERGTKAFTYYHYDAKDPRSLSSNSVWSICEDRHGDLWLGTFGGGVNRFDRKSRTFTRYQHDPENPNSLSNDAVYSVYADTNGNVWIGTWGSGLNRLEVATARYSHYTEREGLPDNFVKGILPDEHGNLWLSTDKGLSRFNPQSGTFKNFTVQDGLLSNQFLSGAYCKGTAGRLFFGGAGGAIAFFPDSIRAHPYVPPVVLTRFKVFDKPVALARALFALEEIQLSYRQNFFSFEFVALDYTVPHQNQYAYMLEGVDPDWINSGTRRYASYTNVDPGEYTFRVKGANSDGVWNTAGASIKIFVAPPFWKTWWFRLLAAAALGVIAFALYQYRVRRLLEMERLRTRIAADLHDEIAGNLSSIAMFGKIVQDESAAAGAPNLAHTEMLQRIIALSQESVIAIREIIWAIDPKPETIYDLLMRVRDFAVNACRAQNVSLQFELLPETQLPHKNLSPEQRKHLWLLLKEAINNALKHSGGTELELRALYESGYLTISLIDNGLGMNETGNTPRFSGRGLGTMQSRAAQLHGALEIFPHPTGGTAVVLTAKI